MAAQIQARAALTRTEIAVVLRRVLPDGSPRAQMIGEVLWKGGVLAAAAVQAAKRLADPDLPWHLALGRLVVSEWRVPRVDPLAVSHRPIEYMEFLSDALLYGMMRSGGPLALQLFGALLFSLLALVLVGRSRGSGPIAFAVLALCLAAVGNWILIRPATISFVLLGSTAWLLDAHRRNPRGLARGMLWPLPAAIALWVNVHGFAVLGLAVVVLYAAYRLACRLAAGRAGALLPSRDGNDWQRATLVAGLCVAASGLNLAGYRLLLAPFRIGSDFTRIAEWQRPTLSFLFSHEPAVLVFALVALSALAFGREGNGGRVPCL